MIAYTSCLFIGNDKKEYVPVIAIDAGTTHAIALKEDGTVINWGNYPDSLLFPPEELKNVKAISAGPFYNLALKEDGTVSIWGFDSPSDFDVPDDLSDVKAISAGSLHCLALKNDGTVVAWGISENGQLDIPSNLTNVKSIIAGSNYSLAIKEDGTVVSWGGIEHNIDTVNGELEIVEWIRPNSGVNIPDGLDNVKEITIGGIVVALKEDGTIVTWGGNNNCDWRLPLYGIRDMTQVVTGSCHIIGLQENGTVISVFGEPYGEYPPEDYGQAIVPTGLNGVKSITAGHNFSIALKDNGSVVAWGYDGYGVTAIPDELSGGN